MEIGRLEIGDLAASLTRGWEYGSNYDSALGFLQIRSSIFVCGGIVLRFEWHHKKALANVQKHGVSFEEAATAFGDPLSLTIDDPLHSHDEDRFVLIGMSHQNRLLVVVHTYRDDAIRIISARKATKKEQKQYESDEK